MPATPTPTARPCTTASGGARGRSPSGGSRRGRWSPPWRRVGPRAGSTPLGSWWSCTPTALSFAASCISTTVRLITACAHACPRRYPACPGHAGWPTATPGAQCLGPERIELAIVPVSAEDLERGDRITEHWEDAFLPVRGRWLRDAGPLAILGGEIVLEGTGLILSAVKPAQNGSGFVLRCYNATDRETAGAWRFTEGVRTAHRVRADERESQALVLEHRGRTLRFVAKPYEIVTIQIT